MVHNYIPSVLIPFTLGVEEIELVAVADILRRADVDVCLASLDGQPVTGRSNIVVHADAALADVMSRSWDMLVLPGGLPNAELLSQNPLVQAMTTSMVEQGKYIAAICAAPKALADFGLLDGKKVTSHPSVKEKIMTSSSAIYLEQAVVEDGLLITSRGAGTAVSFALILVAKLTSRAQADNIKQAILA